MKSSLALVVALVCVAAIDDGARAGQGKSARAPQYVAGEEADLPRIEFAGGLVSVNDRCPVRKVKLNLRMPPVWVNGQPVGFC